MKKLWTRRIFSLLLVCSMIASSLTPWSDAVAKTKESQKKAEKQAEEQAEEALKESIASAVDATKYPKGQFAFYQSQVTGTEGSDTELMIVRAGGTKGSASVTLKAVDVSAKYGEDYLMTIQEGKKKTTPAKSGSGETLMEKYADSITVSDSSAASGGAVSGSAVSETDSKAAVDTEKEEVSKDDLSGLQKAAAAQNGSVAKETEWRELDDSSSEEYKKAEELISDGKKNVKNGVKDMDGVEVTLKFKKGEYKKTITLSAIDDDLSESDEQVMFVMTGSKGAEISDSYTGYYNIKDNEEKEVSQYEMANKAVSVKRGKEYIDITVKKTSGTEQMSIVNIGTTADTAKAGKDYTSVNESLVFPAGMTEKTVSIPLLNDSETSDDVGFYVGIKAVDGVVQSDKNATYVTVTGEELGSDTVYEDSAEGTSADGTMADTNETIVVAADAPKISTTSGRQGNVVASGLDLRTAKSVTIKYHSDEGSTNVTEGSGCSAHTVTKKQRRVCLYLQDRYGITKKTMLDATQENFGSSSNQSTCSLDLSANASLKDKDMKIYASVEGADNNNNATLVIDSVYVTYPDYKIKINNEKVNNEYNKYTPKVYTNAKKPDDQKNTLRLGYAYLNGNTETTSITVHKYSDTFSIGYSYDDSTKNDYGTAPSSDTVNFLGYQIQKGNNWVDISGSVTFENLMKNYSDCMSSYEFKIRPKFSVKTASINFLNNGSQTIQTTENGTTVNKTITQSKAGFFDGFSNNSLLSVTLLDAVKITAKPNQGYAVKGFSTYYKEWITKRKNGRLFSSPTQQASHEQIKTSDVNVITLCPKVTDTIYVDVNYQEAQIEVKALPSGAQHADKGSVLYTYTKNGTLYSLTGNYKNPLSIKDIILTSNYKIIGQQTEAVSSSNSSLQYRASWMDATLDADGDGVISDKEQKDTNYTAFQPVTGDVLSFSPTVPYTKIYYDFVVREKIKNTAKQGVLCGIVSLQDTEIFTGKTTTTPLNGVTVTADGDSGTTVHTEDNRYVDETDGWYSLTGDGSYYTMDTMLVSFNYLSKDGSVLSANVTQNPNVSKEITLYTDSVMSVDSYSAYSIGKDKEGKETETAIQYNLLTNGDNDYRLKFHVTSKNASKKAIKAVLRFYKDSGETEIDNTAITSEVKETEESSFTFNFNPKDLSLPGGTVLKLQIYDQDKTAYYERNTGIVLKKAIGHLDFANRFSFGGSGTVVKLLGKVDSAFNMGWNGEFDLTNTDVFHVDNTTGDLTISIGFSKNGISKDFDISSVGKAAEKKAEAEEKYRKKQDEIEKNSSTADKDQKEKDAEELKKLKEKADETAKDFDEKYDKASDPSKTSTTVAAGLSLDIGFSLMINFCEDKKEGENKGCWYFDSMVLTANVNGGVKVNIDFATPIGITVSIALEVGVKDSSATFVISQRTDLDEPPKYYLNPNSTDAKALQDDDGTIKLFDSEAFEKTGSFSVNPYVSLTAGVGPSSSVQLSVNGRAQFYMSFYTDDTTNSGYVNLSASIGVKVFFIEASWPFLSKNINLFGNGSAAAVDMDDANYLYDSTDIFQAESKDYLKNRSSWNDSKISAMSLDENENGVAEDELREGIYSGTNVQLMALDNGDYLAVFLDDDLDEDGNLSRDSINSAAVFYSIYDHTTKKWAKPTLLEDDGTVDQDVQAFDLGDRGIIVTWSSANKKFTDDMSRVDMLNAMNIHAAFFNKTTETFDDILKVTKDTETEVGNDDVSDVSPNVVYNDDSMIVYYTKNEYAVSDKTEGEVVGDVVNPSYSLMAYRQYNFSSDTGTDGKFVTDYADLNNNTTDNADSTVNTLKTKWGDKYSTYMEAWYGQVFFDTAPDVYLDEELELGYWKDDKEPTVYAGHTVSTNLTESTEAGVTEEKTEVKGDKVTSKYSPKIIDTDAISYNNLGLFAYTVDYDENLRTADDRDVYMQMYDFNTGVMTHPIMVTSDNVADSNVKFTRVKDSASGYEEQTYLTWLSDGNVVAMNMSNVIKNNCLIKKTDETTEQSYYIIDKSSKRNYEPVRTLAAGDVNDTVDGAESSITSFDVKSTDGYVYVTWAEDHVVEKEGAEATETGTADAKDQVTERQIYMSRYDFAEGRSTEKVQVTSGEGANYNDISFVVNDDATVTALATKSQSKLVTVDEFNETIDNYNKNAGAESKQDKLTEDEFTAYTEADTDNVSLVELQITPASVMKIEDCDLDVLVSGSDNDVPFTLLNDGLDTTKDVTLTVKDSDGNSVLTQLKDTGEDSENNIGAYEAVEKIKIDKLMGGERYYGNLSIPLAESAKKTSITFTLTDADGKKLLEKTYSQTLIESTKMTDSSVTETAERDVYEADFTIENDGNTTLDKGQAVISIKNGDKEKELATVEIPKLARGETKDFSEELNVDTTKYFEVTKGENGSVTETGTFYVTYGDDTQEIQVERKASAAQMEYVNGIKSVKIEDGKTMTIEKEETQRAVAEITSSLADDETGATGAEGLDVIWQTEDESIATVTEDMVKGIKEGTTTLYAYVLPKASETIVTVDESDKTTEDGATVYDFGDTVSNYSTVPNDAIRTYSVKLTVTKTSGENDTNAAADDKKKDTNNTTTNKGTSSSSKTSKSSKKTVTKKGITYKISGSSAKVTKAKKTIKSAVIPATVKINGKKYKVTAISKNAFKNCKKLKKVTIGKNVKTISANAFRNCKKLKKIVFKGTKATKIGKNAFKGIAAKAVFRTPKKALKKYKKALKKKVGFKKKTMKVKKN